MDFRSMLDSVKQAFVIGKDNPFLHGRKNGQAEPQSYQEQAYQAPQQAYAPPYGQQAGNYAGYQPGGNEAAGYQQQAAPYQQGFQAPQQEYQQPQGYAQAQGYQQPQQNYQPPQQNYQPPQQPYYQAPAEAPAQSAHTFQSQFNPAPQREAQRNRRSQQHQEQAGANQQPPMQEAPSENLVPFPGYQPQSAQMVDAYVINVFNINSCRQAMSCLRKGQCTLIVMDQLVDKAEIRRYVDMLTGACYALNGTMTRLSAKIGFYIMAPSGMTVYTDPTTSGTNAQPKAAQQPLYRANATPGAAPERTAYEFQGQGAYAPPQMAFQTQASPYGAQAPAEQPYAPGVESYPPQSEAYPYQDTRFAVNN